MSIWVPVVAALGASLLTILGTWLLDARRRRNEEERSRRDSRRTAYLTLLAAANGTLLLGQSMRSLLQAESGLAASLAELMRLRKPMDVYELMSRMTDQFRPLLDAQTTVLACGTVAAAEAAGNVATAATEYLAGAIEMSTTQRALRGLLSWKPGAEQEQVRQGRLDTVGDAVSAFLTVVRRELGEEELPSLGTHAARP